MKIVLTPNEASLTALTVNGTVTVPLRPRGRLPDGVWRQFASHRPRPKFQHVSSGTQQLIF